MNDRMMEYTTRNTRARRWARGFSLLELMFVLVIIGVLGGIVTYNLVNAGTRARISATEASMRTIAGALKNYAVAYGQYPPTGSGLTMLLNDRPPLINPGDTQDAWDREFDYYSPAEQYEFAIISAGPDGEFGTADDIMWTPDSK